MVVMYVHVDSVHVRPGRVYYEKCCSESIIYTRKSDILIMER